jgi:membrane dipeptidase
MGAVSPKDASSSEPVLLDASSPLVQPRTVARHLPALRRGGVDAVLSPAASVEGARDTFQAIARWLELERSGQQPIRIARTVGDIRTAKAEGKLGIVLHFQGCAPIESSVDLLNAYQALGVRVLQLTYNAANLLGDGSTEDRNAGLTALGRQAVQRMEDLGLVLDVSHTGVRTSLEAIEFSSHPVVASHSNARGVCDSMRNLTDEQIVAIAESGGVIGVCAFPAFVSAKDPTLDGLLDHVDYIRDLVGTDHVGLGLDYADEDEDDYEFYGYDERVYPHPPWIWPEGIAGYEDVPDIATALAARGYSQPEITGIMGENFLRVFEQVWGR